MIADRRFLHRQAEVGFELFETGKFVRSKLEEMGYVPVPCGKAGLLVTVGKARGKKALLLRADMDALPVWEKTGLSYAAKNGNMHACGHDLHTAMLLGAARLLKKNEAFLQGEIKLLFQPAEEILEGAKDCIEAGVLEAPEVGGAAMLHVMTAVPFRTGHILLSSAGVTAPAADYFTVEIKGKACHGSTPQNGVDALTAAAYILLALQEIPAREISAASPIVLTVGKMEGGSAGNAIADRAALRGTLRAFDEEVREKAKKRIREIAETVAKTFRAKARVEFGGGCPTLQNDGGMVAFTEEKLRFYLGKENVSAAAALPGGVVQRSGGSEDFAYISRKVPSVMLAIAAGNSEEGYVYPLHHPKARFDEEALVYGAAAFACLALEWNGGADERR